MVGRTMDVADRQIPKLRSRPAPSAQHICTSSSLRSVGRGHRFTVFDGKHSHPAFVVRCGTAVYAYLNRCAHQDLELDWNPGIFFDSGGRYLLCATHGASYEPSNGRCVGGPCNGRGLVPIAVNEEGDEVLLHDDRYTLGKSR